MVKYIVEYNPRFAIAVSEDYYHEWAAMSVLFQGAKSNWRDERPYYAWNNSWWAMVEAETSVDAIMKVYDLIKRKINVSQAGYIGGWEIKADMRCEEDERNN